MELENKVPVDIGRRKIIARLLNIPPMLFGLAVLEEMVLEPQPQASPAIASGQTKLIRVAFEPIKYQSTINTLWLLHETSNAYAPFANLASGIRELEVFEQQTQGDLQRSIREILLHDQILATHIIRDQRRFRQAYYHANEAVRVAKCMQDSDLIATAFFTRGWTRLEWGLFGKIEQNMFQIQQENISAAIRDFQSALHQFPSQNSQESMHPQLLGSLTMYLSRAQAIFARSKGESIPPSVFLDMDRAANTVGKQNIDDLATRTLVRGERINWHEGNYHDHRATTFTALGLPRQALQELNLLERLTEKTYKSDETRRFSYLDILRANIYMELKEFGSATRYAKRALLACKDIKSMTNIAISTDIYGRLLQSRYKNSKDVEELGEIIRESPIVLFEPEE